jgi:hypothetical protein
VRRDQRHGGEDGRREKRQVGDDAIAGRSEFTLPPAGS